MVGGVVSILKVACCTCASVLLAESWLAAYSVCVLSALIPAPGLRYAQGVLGRALKLAGGLVGSSDSDLANGPVTFHHNLYENID